MHRIILISNDTFTFQEQSQLRYRRNGKSFEVCLIDIVDIGTYSLIDIIDIGTYCLFLMSV